MADSSSVITGLNTGKRKQLLHTKVAGAPLRSASCNLSDGGNSRSCNSTIGDAKCDISPDVQLPGYLAVILTIISQ